MIETWNAGVLSGLRLVEIKVRMQLAAFFGVMSMEKRPIDQPCQKAGSAINRSGNAAHQRHSDAPLEPCQRSRL